jgi:hypothetical protein
MLRPMASQRTRRPSNTHPRPTRPDTRVRFWADGSPTLSPGAAAVLLEMVREAQRREHTGDDEHDER